MSALATRLPFFLPPLSRPAAPTASGRTYACARACIRSGRFSVVQSAEHLKEGTKYAVKVVENKSLSDEENLEALETEVRSRRHRHRPSRTIVAAATAVPRHDCRW